MGRGLTKSNYEILVGDWRSDLLGAGLLGMGPKEQLWRFSQLAQIELKAISPAVMRQLKQAMRELISAMQRDSLAGAHGHQAVDAWIAVHLINDDDRLLCSHEERIRRFARARDVSRRKKACASQERTSLITIAAADWHELDALKSLWKCSTRGEVVARLISERVRRSGAGLEVGAPQGDAVPTFNSNKRKKTTSPPLPDKHRSGGGEQQAQLEMLGFPDDPVKRMTN